MKIPLSKIANPEFAQAYGRLIKMPIKAKESYWLVKALHLFDQESKAFTEAQKSCMAKHGIEAGKEYPRETIEAVNAEMKELLDREVEVPMNQVVLPSDTLISASDLVLLDQIVRLDETPSA